MRVSANISDFEKSLKDIEGQWSKIAKFEAPTMAGVAQAFEVVVAGATLAASAIAGTVIAIEALGARGADINDVSMTLEHFAGSATAAQLILSNLREGTMGTVDDFALMKDAAHLLSAGVQLTADDFSTLGQAAFVLQNRGLGGTEEMLKLVSDAMVTGRTRALSMALGVVDVGNAEEAFAASLGVTKDQLTDSGQVEAKRVAVMGMLSAAVADAGVQQRDFGEQIEFAKTQVTNWVDELSSAVASSNVLSDAMMGIADAVVAAFGGSSEAAITTIVGYIEDFAIKLAQATQFAVLAAGYIGVAWVAVKTVFGDVIQIIDLAYLGLLQLQRAAALGILPGSVNLGRWQELNGLIGEANKRIDERGKGLQDNKAEQDAWLTSTQAISAGIQTTIDKMQAHQAANAAMNARLKESGVVVGTLASDIVGGLAPGLERTRLGFVKTGEAATQAAKSIREAQGQNVLKTTSSYLTVNGIPDPTGLAPRNAGAIDAARASIDNLTSSQIELNRVETATGAILGGTVIPMFSELPNVVNAATVASESFGSRLSSTLSNIPSLLQQAFTGGGGLLGALKAIAVDLTNSVIQPILKGLSKLTSGAVSVGAGLAAALGGKAGGAASAAGGLASGLGGAALATTSWGASMAGSVAGAVALGAATAGIGLAAVGAVIAVKKLLNDTEKKINPVREQFVQMHGGLAALAEQARIAGTDLTAMLNAKNPEQYKAAIDALTGALEFQKSAMQVLTDTAQKYGFTLEELGPTLQRQKLGEQAATLFQDFQVLMAGGIDTTAILNRMSESVNAFVLGALRTGTEVPAAMMPMLQQFIDAGLLLDQNGNKITDLETSGLTFATTLTEGFKSVVTAVQQLTDAITRGLGLGVSAAAQQAQAALDGIRAPSFGGTDNFGIGGFFGGGSGNLTPGGGQGWVANDVYDPNIGFAARGGFVTTHGIQRFGMGGFVLPFKPRGTDTVPAMLSPGELVLNQSQQEAFGRPAGGAPQGAIQTQPAAQHVHVYLGDKEVADFVLDAIGDGGKTYGKAERIIRQMVSNRRAS